MYWFKTIENKIINKSIENEWKRKVEGLMGLRGVCAGFCKWALGFFLWDKAQVA